MQLNTTHEFSINKKCHNAIFVDHLTKRLGADGFHFMVEVPTALSDTLDERIDYFLEEASAGRLKKARAGIEELAAANPEAALAHFARGVVHVYDEAHEAALQSFDRAIELDPKMDEAWMNKAAAHRVLGDSVDMIHAYQKVVELTPPDDELHERADDNLKRIAEALYQNDGKTINAYLEAETLFSQAFAHYEKEEFEQAIRIIEDNPDRMPANERSLTVLGNCYRNLKEWDLAREALDQALEINPSHPTAQLAMTVLDAEEQGMDFSSMVSVTLKKLQAEASHEA